MKTEWNLTHLYKKEEDWYSEKEQVQKRIEELASPKLENIFTYIDTLKGLLEQVERLYCYGQRKLDLDAKDKEALWQRTEALNLYNILQGLQNENSQVIMQNREWIVEAIQKAPYQKYTFYITEILRKEEHTLDSHQLELSNTLSLLNLNMKRMYQNVIKKEMQYQNYQDKNGETICVDASGYARLSKNKDRMVRKEAFMLYAEGLKSRNQTMAILLDMKLDFHQKMATLAGYQNPLEATLGEDNLPPAMISHLCETVNQHLFIAQTYYDLRKQYLQLEELHLYDTTVALHPNPSLHKNIEEAIDCIKESLSLLGKDYIEKIEEAMREGYADVYEKENKRTDSFSAISYVGVPYFSLNFKGNTTSICTLAHELGHTIHTMYAKSQPFLYYEYSLFLAEITSKVNEILVLDYLYEQSPTKEDRLAILDAQIQSFMNSLIGQVKLTEFENALYTEKSTKKVLSADEINQIYLEITKKYHPGLAIDATIQYNWESVRHLYLYEPYYFWKYAEGLALASAIVQKLKENENYAEKYIAFLKVGGSMSPMDALQILEMHLEESDYIEKAFQMVEQKVLLYKKELES